MNIKNLNDSKCFKDLFNSWITINTNSQLEIIDEICELLDIKADDWFSNYFQRNDFTGDSFLRELRSDFIFYVSGEFEKQLLKYIKPSGYNIYKQPYLSIDLDLDYNKEIGFFVCNEEEFDKYVKKLTLSQKEDLMQNKLFSTIVIQTKLKIYSNSDIRALKLKCLNEYSKSIEYRELS